MLHIWSMSQCSKKVKKALADLTVSILKEASSLKFLDLNDSGFNSATGEKIRDALEHKEVITLTYINL